MNNLVVARRKGNKIRVFDVERAKMGPWQEIPPASPAWLDGARRHLSTLTVAQLRDHARWMGLRPTTKTRKPDLLDACAVRTYFRQFTAGERFFGPAL